VLLYFQFLEADDIGLLPRQPGHEVMQTLVDVVDIESGYLQGPRLTRKDQFWPDRVVTQQVLRLVTLWRRPQREGARSQFYRRQERGDRRFRLAIRVPRL
jgi:hypothetical protein